MKNKKPPLATYTIKRTLTQRVRGWVLRVVSFTENTCGKLTPRRKSRMEKECERYAASNSWEAKLRKALKESNTCSGCGKSKSSYF